MAHRTLPQANPVFRAEDSPAPTGQPPFGAVYEWREAARRSPAADEVAAAGPV